MEQTDQQAVIAFDTLYTNNHIQILKILLPLFDTENRRNMTVLIKFMELQYTIDHFRQYPHQSDLTAAAFHSTPQKTDIISIFEQIKNFCTPSERSMLEQLASMKKSMEMYEEMQNMMQLFSQVGNDEEKTAASGSENGDFSAFTNSNPMDMLKGMLSPEQQAMFEMFQSSFGQDN